MTTLERLLDAAETMSEKGDIASFEGRAAMRAAHKEYKRLREALNVKKGISLYDDVIVGNGWRVISYSESGMRYRLDAEKPIDIVYFAPTGNYRVHYDGNICKVSTLADVENFLSIVGVHLDLRPCDLFG